MLENKLLQNTFHTPVLLQAIIDALQIQPESWYVDATLGGGGHTQAILEKGGKVLGIDQDSQAIEFTSNNLKEFIDKKDLIIVKSNFENLGEILEENQIEPSGILFDLGVSSHQLDEKTRGFSFQGEDYLDMRMDQDADIATAADLLNELDFHNLHKIIAKYGEEPLAREIAQSIVNFRKSQPFETTKQLADLISEIYFNRYHKHSTTHPATKTFQALRMTVNSELEVIKIAVKTAIEKVKSGGSIVVISFHGLEDRTVQRVFRQQMEFGLGKIVKAVTRADENELERNRRSRTAQVRIFTKL